MTKLNFDSVMEKLIDADSPVELTMARAAYADDDLQAARHYAQSDQVIVK